MPFFGRYFKQVISNIYIRDLKVKIITFRWTKNVMKPALYLKLSLDELIVSQKRYFHQFYGLEFCLFNVLTQICMFSTNKMNKKHLLVEIFITRNDYVLVKYMAIC